MTNDEGRRALTNTVCDGAILQDGAQSDGPTRRAAFPYDKDLNETNQVIRSSVPALLEKVCSVEREVRSASVRARTPVTAPHLTVTLPCAQVTRCVGLGRPTTRAQMRCTAPRASPLSRP